MDYTNRIIYLKYKIIDESICVSEVLRLMKDEALKPIICDIDEESFYNDTEKKGKLSINKFIELLNNFVELFLGTFINMRAYVSEMKNTISSCDNLLVNYFSYNTNEINQDDYVYKIIFYNFIDNVKYIPHIKNLLKEKEIPLKNVVEYSHEECLKLVKLMSDLVFCRGNAPILSLFVNVSKQIEQLKQKSEDANFEIAKAKYLNSVNRDFEILFQNYKNKKDYLKYFK